MKRRAWRVGACAVAMSMVGCEWLLGVHDLPAEAGTDAQMGVNPGTGPHAMDAEMSPPDSGIDATLESPEGSVPMDQTDGGPGPPLAPDGSSCAVAPCEPIVLASGQGSPWGIAVDSSNVYWTDWDGGTVMKLALDGGLPVPLAAGVDAYDIALDATHVYWATLHGIVQVAKAGGSANPLGGQLGGPGVAVDVNYAYGAFAATLSANSYKIEGLALDGGSVLPVAMSQTTPARIVVDATSVYWTNKTSVGSVMRAPLDGGAPTPVASNQSSPEGLTVDGQNIYWTEATDPGAIRRAPLDGGLSEILVLDQSVPSDVAVDSTNVYWSDEVDGGSIMKMPLGGGTPVAVATAQARPHRLVVDAAHVYWTNMGDGTVMRAAK